MHRQQAEAVEETGLRVAMKSQPIVPALELEQRVKAPLEVVFAYFTDPRRHSEWLGYQVELDARPGGMYRVRIAPGVEVRGEFIAVEQPRRLAYTWGWSSVAELPGGVQNLGPGSTVVEIVLTSEGDETVVNLRHHRLSHESPAEQHGLRYRRANVV